MPCRQMNEMGWMERSIKVKLPKCRGQCPSIIHVDLKLPRVMAGAEAKKKVSHPGTSTVNIPATRSSIETLNKEMRRMGLSECMEFKGDGNFQDE